MRHTGVHLAALRTLLVIHFILRIVHTGYTTHSQETSPSIPLSEILNEEERIMLLGSHDADPVYQIIQKPITVRRSKIQADLGQSDYLNVDYDRNDDDEELMLKLSTLGENFHIALRRNSYLENGRPDMNGHLSALCYYHGHSENHPNSSAALSVCGGVRGFIETSDRVYTIFPLPDHAAERLQPSHSEKQLLHLVVRRDASPQTFCPHALRRVKHFPSVGQNIEEPEKSDKDRSIYEKNESMKNSSRNRRSTTGSSVIETAVFIDQALYEQMKQTFPKDTDRQLTTFVLTMMNAVQRLFQHSSLGKSPNIKLVLLEILKTQPQELHPSDNIDTYLTNFCIWQHNRRHYGRGKTPRWDHALLLSGINMYVVDESGRRKRHVVGLAPVSGMCNPLNSCTISEGTSFQTVLVAAHEMGHSLGMEHDGHQDGNHCDSDTFVMSPTLGSGKTTWSSCSRQYLEKFLKSPQANCLHSTNERTTDLLDPPPEKQPGQMYDADYQCALRYGDGSRRSSLQTSEEICRMLRCDTGYGSKGVSFAAHPALEGTSCGRDQWCQGGSCVPMLNSKGALRGQVVDGSWSAWSPYNSPCSSDCVERGSSPAVGIMVSTRRCDNPRPSNGGRLCVGKDRRVVICDASRICSLLTRKLDLNEFISDTCRQAATRDSTLENSGTQFPSQENSHSCYVWCHKRGGGYMTQGWTIPDGTPCWRGYNQRNMYCVKGECQAFDCNGYSTEDSSGLHCSSSSTVSNSEITPAHQPQLSEVGWTSWHTVSHCRSSCLLGAKGFQLVTRECNSVTGCTGQRDTFQLCDAPSPTCGLLKTVDQYATEICQRYRTKYPTVLSGKGRQLPAQTGNPHSACIVACQDRVWQDTHYQMDVYEDGKFPFGTDCSSDSRTKAHCLNGKCLQFTEEGTPVSTETGQMYEVRRYVSRIRRRDTSGANHVVNVIDDTQDNTVYKKWMHATRFPGKHSKKHKKNRLPEWSSKSEFGWAVEMSECSAACGGGVKNITVTCQTGSTVVDDGFCSGVNKPGQTGTWPCNTHPCSGRWQGGAWSACSATCGKGLRFRDVICIQQLSDNIFSIVHESQCPEPVPATEEICFQQNCSHSSPHE